REGRPAQRCRLVPGVRPGRRPLAFQGGGCRCGGCCLGEGQGRVEEGRPQEGRARPVVHSWWGAVTRHPTARPSSPIGRGHLGVWRNGRRAPTQTRVSYGRVGATPTTPTVPIPLQHSGGFQWPTSSRSCWPASTRTRTRLGAGVTTPVVAIGTAWNAVCWPSARRSEQ